MKKLILLLHIVPILSFGQTLIKISSNGETKEIAQKNVFRSAIEQAYGVYISTNTEILNDELVKDEIVTISNGNIISYKNLIEKKISENNYYILSEVEVSLNNIAKFVKSKGENVEFDGKIFAADIKQKKLNEESELISVENLIETSLNLLKDSYDFKVIADQPKSHNSLKKEFIISTSVLVSKNKNYFEWEKYFENNLVQLLGDEKTFENYNKLGILLNSIRIGNDLFYFRNFKSYDKIFQLKSLIRKMIEQYVLSLEGLDLEIQMNEYNVEEVKSLKLNQVDFVNIRKNVPRPSYPKKILVYNDGKKRKTNSKIEDLIFGEIDLKLNLIQLESLKGISFKRIDRNKTSNPDEKINKFISSYEKGMNQVVVSFNSLENVPVFPGCENTDKSKRRDCFQNKINEYIKNNISDYGIQGRVLCNFIINEDGFIEQIRVRGNNKSLEEDALKVIERLPRFYPALQRGKIVKTAFSIPITYRFN